MAVEAEEAETKRHYFAFQQSSETKAKEHSSCPPPAAISGLQPCIERI